MTPPPDKSAPTIQDVATALGMHKSTVSLGLSGKGTVSPATRARIVETAREMGYEPNPLAQRLANSGRNNLVYLCSGGLDVGLATEKILTIQDSLRPHKLEVPIYSLSNSAADQEAAQAKEMRDLCRQKPRAIIYATQGWYPAVLAELERYQHQGGVVVCYDMEVPLACDQVVFDREHNAYQTAKYLLDRGHRRLGINPSRILSSGGGVAPNPRLAGFKRALAEFGLEANAEWIFDMSHYEAGGAEMAARFMALKERPTAMCIVNDYSALAFMVEVMRAGVSIPQELSIVGHDNEAVANYCPVPMTCAIHPTAEITAAVVQLLLQRLTGTAGLPQTLYLKGGLVERASVQVLASQP